MADYSNRTCLVADNGLFVELALTLSQSFGTVYYWSPWVSAFPKSNPCLIGVGLPGIERVRDVWDVVDDVDLFVFPHVYHGPLQLQLERMGKRVWGARSGEELELDRVFCKDHCEAVGIDIGLYDVVIGLDALREYLKANDDQYVKVSVTRGDVNTFHAKNYKLIEPQLDQLEYNLGAKKKITEFVVEAAINDAVEIGFDGYCINGQYPDRSMIGVEVKDRGYLAEYVTRNKLPAVLRDVNDKLSPYFQQHGYRGFFSTEVRATKDGRGYLIDPCCRLGSPPGELFGVMITNLATVLWEGAVGNMIEPNCAGKFGAQLQLRSAWAEKNWQPIDIPPQYRDFVKLWNVAEIDGKLYVVPQFEGSEIIGAAVAYGDTVEGVVQAVRTIAASVEGYFIEAPLDALDEAVATYQQAKALT